MNELNIDQFGQELADAIVAIMPQTKQVKLNHVLKNNGIRAVGITIMEEETNVAPTLYVDVFYERYQRGSGLEQLARDFLQVYERYQIKEKIDLSFFTDYQKVQERIVFKLVNGSLNRELLGQIPHKTFMDLEVVFYCMMEHESMGNATILIRQSHLDMWQVSQEEIWRMAKKNTPRLLPEEICDMQKIISEMTVKIREELLDDIRDIRMYVMTNKKRFLGAAVLLYDNAVRQFAYTIGRNLYIIPSSVHELILVPDDGLIGPGGLNQIVREVNREQLDEREILADHVYYYDYKDDILTACI